MTLLSRLAALFRKGQLDARLDDEMRFHLEMQIEENISRGMSPQEARRQAHISSGGLEQAKELHRDARGLPFLESVFQDIRFALRSFAKTPTFTATVLLTLALGIGVGTAMFAIVNAVLLQPPPYKDPDSIVMLWSHSDEEGRSLELARNQVRSMGAAEFLDRKRHSRSYSDMTAVAVNELFLKNEAGAERVNGLFVSDGFFDVVGVEPILGRRFLPEEYNSDWNNVAIILQYDVWRTRFGADPEIVGKHLPFSYIQCTVVGVMPPGFSFLQRNIEYLRPYELERLLNRRREAAFFAVAARLQKGVSVGQAQAETDQLTAAMAEQYPESRSFYEHADVKVVPISEDATEDLRPALTILFGAVAVVMLIVSSNVASLLLGRAAFRTRELTIRAAIGAGRGRLIRQLLTESVLLALVGGAAGLWLAHLFVRHFQSMVPSSDWGVRLVQADFVRVDAAAALFAAGVALASGLVFGVLPALRASRTDLNTALKDVGTIGSGPTAGGRRALVVLETALAVVLVGCAGLLMRSFVAVYQQGPGFQTEKRIWIQLSPGNVLTNQRLQELRQQSEQVAARHERQEALYLQVERMRERVASLPGVLGVAINSWPEMTRSDTNTLWVSRDGTPTDTPCEVAVRSVSPNYFALMGIPILEGRDFSEEDHWAAPPVLAASQQAVRACWSGAGAIGSEARISTGSPRGPRNRAVAVVGDVWDEGVDREPLAVVYRPFAQDGQPFFALVVHVGSDSAGLVQSVRNAIREVDSGEQPTLFHQVRSVEEMFRDSAWKLNYSTLMLGSLASLALLLAAVGVYGVLSQSVRQRTREIGLRMALGAERAEVRRMIVQQGLKPVAVGLLLGLAAAAAVTRVLGSLLYGVEPLDPLTFAAVVVVLLASALLASYIPARRAAQVDPMSALRHE